MSARITRSQIRNQSNQLQIESSSINECGVFNIVECDYDGDCLFSSILDFLTQNNIIPNETPQVAQRVRGDTVEYILSRNSIGFQENWDRFYGSIKFNLESRIKNLADYGKNDRTDKAVKQSYREYMANTRNFGTFSELCAAAELYGFSGYLFQRDESNNFRCYDFGLTGNSVIDNKNPQIYLLFTGPTEEGHFRRLEPSIAPSKMHTGMYLPINSSTTQQDSKITIKKVQGTSSKKTSSTGINPKSSAPQQKTHSSKTPSVTETVLNMDEQPPSTESTPSSNDPPTCTFTCDVCKQSFPTKRGLGVHRNRHVKEANERTASQLNARLNAPAEPSTEAVSNVTTNKSALDSECSKWNKVFADFENSADLNEAAFDEKVEDFQKFLLKANKRLPGPQHPSIKFYKLRHQQKNRKLTSAQQSRSSNPQRTDTKARQRRRDKYQYDLAQYWYYNQRKKAVRMVMTKNNSRQCKIKMDIMENHFKSLFETENNRTLETYPIAEKFPNITVSEEEIQKQIKKMPLDTSAGVDRVLVKTLRQLNIAKSISSIANSMLRSSYVPSGFRKGIMIFIDKEGDVNSISNWRPIIIFSVIRRIIEKALDAILRTQAKINRNQRGFISGIAGCHINARLVNACLLRSKKFKSNCVAAFLDVSKAYDRIGHLHISKSLKSKGISDNLHDLIMSLLMNNVVEIAMGKEISKPIQIRCGVAQGAPLSPILFNIAIDYLYEEICDPQYANNNGYRLSDEYDPVCLSGFADDQAVTSDSETSAIRTIELIKILFLKIGLEINPAKSQAIIIRDGKLIDISLHFSDGSEIIGVKQDERIKYLGCSFNSELIFDNSSIDNLNKNLNMLSTSPVLKPDQKLNIVNQYIFPTLIYPLQSAPINKIPAYVTQGLDVMIRRTVKEIIGLPMRTTDFLFYSPRRLRGLGLFRAEWEVYLQHFAIASKLSQANDGLFQSISNCTAEMNTCIQALNVVGDSSKTLRTALRNQCFDQWCSQKYQGSGVLHFKNHTPSNDFVYNKNSLSSSEWVSAIKLSTNYANLNGVPGVGGTSLLCRKCNREKETIAHVTGSCDSNNLLISSRHHLAKHRIADLLRAKRFTCYVEVYAIDTDGKSRFSDIIAFHPTSNDAYIIDPTIRYETSNTDQDKVVREEKENIYKKCIPFYEEKYMETFGKRNWSVRGLWFGGRGAFGASVIDFFKEFKLDSSELKKLSEEILIKTIHIINNHIYN